ncbi:hypothetical protein BDFG_04898 [Blastomyces dermatitidis ATCC 26199]|nr:hypothetical protein BDFG_04898 [Blastomyces dermatitidis ATCC 26199]
MRLARIRPRMMMSRTFTCQLRCRWVMVAGMTGGSLASGSIRVVMRCLRWRCGRPGGIIGRRMSLRGLIMTFTTTRLTSIIGFISFFQPDGRHLLYYSGELDVWRRHHCIGVAVSETTDPRGPYKAEGTYLACPSAHGGGIHPSAINDADGTIYVVYKGDGNSMNRYPSGSDSSDCTQAIPPLRSTPLLLQKMKADGIRADGEAVQILDRVAKEDGPLVEAPSLIRSAQGVYFLFYSSHCSDSRAYDVKYATARRITGPYVRAERPLLKTGDFGLVAPGGASVSKDGGKIAFHADCGDEGRCMWVAAVEIDGLEARVVASPSIKEQDSFLQLNLLTPVEKSPVLPITPLTAFNRSQSPRPMMMQCNRRPARQNRKFRPPSRIHKKKKEKNESSS